MGRQAGETEWAGTTNQAKFSPIGAGSLLPSLALYKKSSLLPWPEGALSTCTMLK